MHSANPGLLTEILRSFFSNGDMAATRKLREVNPVSSGDTPVPVNWAKPTGRQVAEGERVSYEAQTTVKTPAPNKRILSKTEAPLLWSFQEQAIERLSELDRIIENSTKILEDARQERAILKTVSDQLSETVNGNAHI